MQHRLRLMQGGVWLLAMVRSRSNVAVGGVSR